MNTQILKKILMRQFDQPVGLMVASIASLSLMTAVFATNFRFHW
jgi:hypothetical protein